MSHVIPLSRPDIGTEEERRVIEVLRSGRLAMGPVTDEFEERFAELCQVGHAVALSSGTAALHLIVRALGIGDGDEIVTTPYSFVASANVALFERATPVFVDIDARSLNIDVDRIGDAITPRTRAILAVDVFGLPADWPALSDLAAGRGVHLIDDACEAFGALVGDRPIGSWGTAAAFGFYPNKQITTGEGGCLATDDKELASTCRSMRNQGRTAPHRMEHGLLGYNYRMTEVSAAIGCAQLDRLSEMSRSRERVAAAYDRELADLQGELTLPLRPPHVQRSWFTYVVRLADVYEDDARDVLAAALAGRGIETAPYFPAIHLQPLYRDRFGYNRGAFPNAEAASVRTLALPFHTSLSPEDVRTVSRAVRELLPGLPRRKTTVAASDPETSS